MATRVYPTPGLYMEFTLINNKITIQVMSLAVFAYSFPSGTRPPTIGMVLFALLIYLLIRWLHNKPRGEGKKIALVIFGITWGMFALLLLIYFLNGNLTQN